MKPVEYQLTGNINVPGVFDAEEVREFAIVAAIVNHEVGDLACFERAELRPAIQAVSSVDRRRRD